jgi:uncharacterized protein YyaL (SSP411 family)
MTHTNRLVDEKSPYLQQHAHNPVDWYPWGEEAFEKARRENKAIFLSVGYSTCYWCHVMERESFENEEIARLLNENFVSIKVDREERPDIDQTYMDAVQVITGRGGWPMSAFLLPDGRPFHGGTYFPREQFARILTEVARMFREDREMVAQAADEIARAVEGLAGVPEREAGSRLGRHLIRRALEALHRNFDAENGGFGTAPKFPPHTALALLLREYGSGRGEGLLEMAKHTLDSMALGGIHDHIGGGFHRYSTDERWLVPHFEKMLYDNALLSRRYIEAYAVTHDPFYREVAESIYGWVEREMTSPEGAFYSALDAESEGVEGKFYVWTSSEIAEVLGDADAEFFADIYGIEEEGNYAEEATGRASGENIPFLERRPLDLAADRGMAPVELRSRVAAARGKLLEVRSGRPRPRRDDKVLASWNGLMIGSLAYAGRELSEPRYTEAGVRAADFLLANLWVEDRLLRRWRDGEARFQGYLEDYVFAAYGLVELYEATGDRKWLEWSTKLMDAAIADFWDQSEGGFFYTGAHAEQLLGRRKDALDRPLPSGNGTAALLLLRLANLTGNESYAEYAGKTLHLLVPWMERAPYGTETLHLATAIYLDRAERRARREPLTAPSAEPEAVTVEKHPVKLTAAASKAIVGQGDEFEIAIELEVAEGWHINSHSPRQGFLVPTSLDTTDEAPVTLGEIAYPAGHDIDLAGESLSVYDGVVRFSIPAKVAADSVPGEGPLTFTLRFQACDDKSCLAPEQLALELPLRIAAAQ